MWENWVPLFVAALALIGSIYNTNVTRGKMDKTDAVALEGRLKDIEAGQKLIQLDLTTIKENMITPEQKACLLIVDERVNTILAGLGTFVPKALKNPEHLDAILDVLSFKASTGGWVSVVDYVKTELEPETRTDLLTYLRRVSTEEKYKGERRHWATLYLGLLQLELEREDTACIPA